MRYRLRTLLLALTLFAIVAGLSGPTIASAIKDWNDPKPRTPRWIFDDGYFKKVLQDWERSWNGEGDEHRGRPQRGGII